MPGEPWADAELELLAEYYPRHGARWDGWALLLPARAIMSIRSKARARGIRYQGPCKAHPVGWERDSDERAAAAVAALDEWQRVRLWWLMRHAGERERG